jgi:hypothetical protein
MHSVDTLQHNLVALSLGSAMQVADVGDGVVGLRKVGVAESVGDLVVELLNRLIWFLTKVLEADAKCLGGVLWCVGFKKFTFQIIPVFFIEVKNVVQSIVPGKGIISEREVKFVHFSKVRVCQTIPTSNT